MESKPEASRKLLGYNFKTDITIPVSDQVMARLKGIVFDSAYEIPTECVTLVKKQYITNCWAFAATAMLESYLLQKGWTQKALPDNHTFSETHMTYSVFDVRGTSTTPSNTGGLLPSKPILPKTKYGYEANKINVTSYFSKRKNTVLEVIDKNFLTGSVDFLPRRDNNISLLKYRNFIVKGLYFIEDPAIPNDPGFIDRIKYSVKQYGLVVVSFEFVDVCLQTTKFPLQNKTQSYNRNTTTTGGGHAVVIVGWDDNFPIANFKNKPSNPGAFKVKNSWGTGGTSGDGYIWISYENIGFGSAYCLTEMIDDINNEPAAVYSNCKFGMLQSCPIFPGEATVTFEDTFTIGENGEKITGIGLCNLTPCFATVTLLGPGMTSVVLITKAYLSYPGYHLVDIVETILGSKGASFTIQVVYEKIGLTGVFVPLEYKYSKGYDNLDLTKVSGSIALGKGIKETIKDINKKYKTSFGNLALYVMTKGTGKEAKNNFLAYKALVMPAPVPEGRIDNLPATIKPATATADVPIKWRAEPYNFTSYNPSYKSHIKIYEAGKISGMINTSSRAEKVFVTAVIGSDKYAMKKLFQVTIPPQNKAYTFDVSAITNANEVDISGKFPVPLATVLIQCNNVSESIKTDANGDWVRSKFALYDVNNGGWNDNYANSKITVTLQDDNGILFCTGTSNAALTRPFSVDGTVVAVTVVCTAGLVAAILYACKSGCSCQVAAGGYVLLPSNTAAIHDADTSMMDFSGGSSNISSEGNLFNNVRSVDSVKMNIRYRGNRLPASDSNMPSKFGALANKITKGGYVKNCRVSLDVSGVDDLGGLFYEGEGVTVSGCEVIAKKIDNVGSCGLIAHTMTGNSSIDSSQVNGTITADSISGIVVNASGSIKNSVVNIEASAKTAVAGVCQKSNDAIISNMLIQGSYVATENNAMASGIVNDMTGGSVSDCRVSGIIHASSYAAGIASKMTNSASIRNCYSACTIKSIGNNAFAAGISASGGQDTKIENCVSICSHLSGKNVARIAFGTVTNCIAYNGITFDEDAVVKAGDSILKAATDFIANNIYSDLGWDLTNIWEFDINKFPKLKLAKATQEYDYPFPYPKLPEGKSQFEYPIGETVAILGVNHLRATKITWGDLSPKMLTPAPEQGKVEILAKDGEFYIQIVSFPEKGKYGLLIISVLDGHKYTFPIELDII